MSVYTYRQPKHPFVLIPLYIYPLKKGHTWAPLFEAVSRYPDLSFVVIVNPDSGPGRGPVPDENYLAVLRTLGGFSNVTILGYVAVRWAEREYNDVARDVGGYYRWEKGTRQCHRKERHNSILTPRIDGIFFDETPANATEENVTYMSRAANLARTLARSPDRPCNNTATSLPKRDTETSHLTEDTTPTGYQLSDQRGPAEHDHHQCQAPSPCTIVYNPGTPPSHQSPFFDSWTQADYIVVFEQTLATWPSPTAPKTKNTFLERESLLSKQQLRHSSASESSSASASSSSSCCSSPPRWASDAVPAPDPGADTVETPNMEETDSCASEHKTAREYIASCLASLSPGERGKSIAIAHSVSNLTDQLRFAAEAVDHGLAGHFATSSGDYSSWSGPLSSEEDCLGSENTVSPSPDGGFLDEEGAANTTGDSSLQWMSYVEEANRLASRKVREQTLDRVR